MIGPIAHQATLGADVVESLQKRLKGGKKPLIDSFPGPLSKRECGRGGWTSFSDETVLSTSYQGLSSAPGFLVIGTKKTCNTDCCSIFAPCFRNRLSC